MSVYSCKYRILRGVYVGLQGHPCYVQNATLSRCDRNCQRAVSLLSGNCQKAGAQMLCQVLWKQGCSCYVTVTSLFLQVSLLLSRKLLAYGVWQYVPQLAGQ